MGIKLCFTGKVHKSIIRTDLTFRIACAEVELESSSLSLTYKFHKEIRKFFVCTEHLDQLLDYTDDHPENEPRKLRWVYEN